MQLNTTKDFANLSDTSNLIFNNTGGSSGTGNGSSSTSSSSGTNLIYNGTSNIVGNVSGFLNSSDLLNGNDSSFSDSLNNIFVDNSSDNSEFEYGSTQRLEKINSELNYIMNSLNLQQNNEIVERIQISSPQIVAAGSNLCSDIGFFDKNGNQFEKYIFKLDNNSYYGFTYSSFNKKTGENIENNKTLTEDNLNFNLVKLNRNISKSQIYTYVFTDYINNRVTYNEYSGNVQTIGNTFIGNNIPKQINLKLTNITSYYNDKFGLYYPIAKINNNIYTKENDVIYKLEKYYKPESIINETYYRIECNFASNINKLYLYDVTSDTNFIDVTSQIIKNEKIIDENLINVFSYSYEYAISDTEYLSKFEFSYAYQPKYSLNDKLIFVNDFNENIKTGIFVDINTYTKIPINNTFTYELIYSDSFYIKNYSNTFEKQSYALSLTIPSISYFNKTQLAENENISNNVFASNIITNDKYTYQLTYITKKYEWNSDIKYKYESAPLYLKDTVTITYNYYNIEKNSYIEFEGDSENIFFINDNFYGILFKSKNPDLSYKFHVNEIFERSYFNSTYTSSASKTQLAVNNQEYLNISKQIPFTLKNDIILNESTDYFFNPPIFGDIVFKNETSANFGEGDNIVTATYDSITYKSTILKDGFWYKKYKEDILPLIISSYSYNISPLEISNANILPNKKEEILSKIHYPKITYHDYVNTYIESFKYTYYNDKNVPEIFNGKVIFNNDSYYGILTKTGEIEGKYESYSYTYNELVQLNKILNIEVKQVLKELTYCEDTYVNQSVMIDTPFRLLNGYTVNITKQTYVPALYKDIQTINPLTNEPELKNVKIRDSYISYEYNISEVPFKTASYIYHKNGISISNLNDLTPNLTNLTYLSTLKTLPNLITTVNTGLERNLKNLSSSIENNLSKISEKYSLEGELNRNYIQNFINRTEINNDKNNERLTKTLVTLSTVLSDSLQELNQNYNKVSNQTISENKTNIHNIIESNKHQLSKLTNEILSFSKTLTSSLNENSNKVINQISLVNHVDKLQEWSNISLIGKKEYKEICNVSYKSTPIKGSKIMNKIPIYSYSYSYIDKFYETPLNKISYSYKTFNGANELTQLIGLHLSTYTYQYIKDNNIYQVDKSKYLGIADILYEMSRRIPTKEEFIVELSKEIYIQSNLLYNTTYTSPNEFAKKSIYYANILWNELKNNNIL